MLRGGFPELYEKPEIDARGFFQSYVATYLERDRRLAACVLAGPDQGGGFPAAPRRTHHAGRCQVDSASVRNRAAKQIRAEFEPAPRVAILCRYENPYPLGNDATALALSLLSSILV